MRKIFTSMLSIVLVLITAFSLVACTSNSNSTSETSSNKSTKFIPSKDMKKLVLVTNRFVFDADYKDVLNEFNLKLSELGKKYYLEIKVIDNLPSNKKEREAETALYSKKYHQGILKMNKNNEQADILTLDCTDDSDYYFDYDYFYLNSLLKPMDKHINSDTSLKKYINDGEWTTVKRDKNIYAVPTRSIEGSGRGWMVETSVLKSSGISAEDLQAERWDILDDSNLSDKKIHIDPQEGTKTGGLGIPQPPYCADQYYDLITPCVGVKLDSKSPKAINIFDDEYMTKSIASTYNMTTLENCKLSISSTYTSNSKITTADGYTTIPINDKFYDKGNVSGLGIASWSKNEKDAYDLISLLNTNEELAMLLNYGIKDKNYTLSSDGTVEISESQYDSYKNTYYIFSNKHILPKNNQELFTDNSKSTTLSPICGFVFDYTKVKAEIDATNKLINKYKNSLFVGDGSYTELNEKFGNDLKNAGVQKIVDEANRQISKWQKTVK